MRPRSGATPSAGNRPLVTAPPRTTAGSPAPVSANAFGARASIPSSVLLASRQRTISMSDSTNCISTPSGPGSIELSDTRRSGSANGSGRSSVASMTAKIAVVVARPSASVRSAVSA